MRWQRGYRSTNVDDRRAEGPVRGLGGMGGGGIPIGSILAIAGRWGWKGILVALLVVGALMYGGTGMCSGGGAPAPAPKPESSGQRAGQVERQPDDMESFVGYVLDDAQATFAREVKGYEPARLTLFRGSIASACGTATSAVGPFYCQLDKHAYIDLAFYEQLRRELGAPGDFAQAYVIAHELGHHVQNLRGDLGRGEVNQIEIELQADCLAGAWARDAEKRGLLEPGDMDEALNAAAQIGDDTLQKKNQGYVQPETWTHGSAKQRAGAFRKGHQGGVPACD
jgi:predicted metalloprotease